MTQKYSPELRYNKGRKQGIIPGIFPGVAGLNPVSFPNGSSLGYSQYFNIIKTINMNIKPYLLSPLCAFLVILFCTHASAHNNIRYSFAGTVPASLKTDTGGGQVVRLDLVQGCIASYNSVMQAHGFSNPGGQPANINITTTAPITTGETFNGKKLLDWLSSTAMEYSKAGKKFMVRIAFGMYNMDYLNVYEPNAALRAKLNGRMAVFLIPIDASTGQSFQSAAMVAAAGAGGGSGGTGYDFGGLQP